MLNAIQKILVNTADRLSVYATEYLPSFLAGLIIIIVAYLIALLIRSLLNRIFKGIALDRLWRRSGMTGLFPHSERIRSARLLPQIIYSLILVTGFMIALNICETPWTQRAFESLMVFFPGLLTGGLIVLAGIWLGHYWGRNMLVWAVNEELPGPRRLALLVKVMVIFTFVAIAADVVNFARWVILPSYLMVFGGTIITLCLILGLGRREEIKRFLLGKSFDQEKEETVSEEEKPVMHHL